MSVDCIHRSSSSYAYVVVLILSASRELCEVLLPWIPLSTSTYLISQHFELAGVRGVVATAFRSRDVVDTRDWLGALILLGLSVTTVLVSYY